jgi:hypothetical protein
MDDVARGGNSKAVTMFADPVVPSNIPALLLSNFLETALTHGTPHKGSTFLNECSHASRTLRPHVLDRLKPAVELFAKATWPGVFAVHELRGQAVRSELSERPLPGVPGNSAMTANQERSSAASESDQRLRTNAFQCVRLPSDVPAGVLSQRGSDAGRRLGQPAVHSCHPRLNGGQA